MFDINIGDVVRFDYTCKDGSTRHRTGEVESIGEGFFRIRFGAMVRTACNDGVTNLTVLVKRGEEVPAGWDHI